MAFYRTKNHKSQKIFLFNTKYFYNHQTEYLYFYIIAQILRLQYQIMEILC